MGWSGAGGYTANNGIKTGDTLWTETATAGNDIEAAHFDTFSADIADGFENCLARNGENAATGSLNIGSQRLLAVGKGTTKTDGVNVEQVQDSEVTYLGTVAGTDTYTASLTPALTAYAAGQRFIGICTNANTAASTLNINSLGAKNIYTVHGQALIGGEIGASGLVDLVYDGTQFQLQNPSWSYAALAADGTNQATAAQIASTVVAVTAADAVKGVKLVAAVKGRECIVQNYTTPILWVYPATGDQINGGGVNVGIILNGKETAHFIAIDGDTWMAVNNYSTAVSAITATGSSITDAAVITGTFATVTCDNTAKGVKLPPAQQGMVFRVINISGVSSHLYADAAGTKINNVAGNDAATTLTAYTGYTLVATSSSAWWTV